MKRVLIDDAHKTYLVNYTKMAIFIALNYDIVYPNLRTQEAKV